MRREDFFDILTKAQSMAYMGKIGLFRLYAVYHFQGFLEVEVGNMRVDLKGIKHQNAGSLDFFHFILRNVIRIRNVGEITYPVAKYGQFVMENLNRLNRNPVDHKGIVTDFIYLHTGCTGVFMVSKHIRKFGLQLVDHRPGSIDGYIPVLAKIKRPDIIHPRRVVFMLVRKNQRIQLDYALPQHLRPKIRPRVNHKTPSVYFNMDRSPEAFIPKVQRLAHLTDTADYRDALGCACTKKSYSQSFNSVC